MENNFEDFINENAEDPSANSVNFEPEPLRAPIPQAEPYPVDQLGDVLGAAAKALHETITGRAFYPAASLLGQNQLLAVVILMLSSNLEAGRRL